jgi:hypothetical protein
VEKGVVCVVDKVQLYFIVLHVVDIRFMIESNSVNFMSCSKTTVIRAKASCIRSCPCDLAKLHADEYKTAYK